MVSALKKIAAALSVLAIILSGYFLLARPYQMRWGATTEEVERAMPGDALNANPTFLATRAVTIDTTPEAIWPWLIQMGFHRAGFYGYDIIEGIGSRSGMQSADRIIAELQHPAIGDSVPISVAALMRFYAIDSNRSIIWSEVDSVPHGGFTWALYPVDANHTRLVSRMRWSHHWTQAWILSLELLTEFTDHLAVRKILAGIKTRAEGREIESMTMQSIEFFYYLLAVLLFVIAIVFLFVRPLTTTRYLLCLAIGVSWLVIWYSPLPIWGGVVLEIATIWGMYSVLFRRETFKVRR